MVKRPSLLLLCSSPLLLALACSSSTPSHKSSSTASAPPPVTTAPVPEPVYADNEPAARAQAPGNGESAAANEQPSTAGSSSQSATFAPDSATSGVQAKIKTLGKNAKDVGSLKFSQEGDSVTIAGDMENLPRGAHGIKILESTSCEAVNNKTADFNPTGAKHGPLDSAERHVGDLGNIEVDRSGEASFELTTDSLTVEPDGASSVLDRVVVITQNKDDGKTQPAGRAGKPIACGKITASS